MVNFTSRQAKKRYCYSALMILCTFLYSGTIDRHQHEPHFTAYSYLRWWKPYWQGWSSRVVFVKQLNNSYQRPCHCRGNIKTKMFPDTQNKIQLHIPAGQLTPWINLPLSNIIYNTDSHRLGDTSSLHKQFFKAVWECKLLLVSDLSPCFVCMKVYKIFKRVLTEDMLADVFWWRILL